MKGFMKRVDLFCYKHPRFGVDNLMMIICIANIAVWLFSAMDTTGQLRGLLALEQLYSLGVYGRDVFNEWYTNEQYIQNVAKSQEGVPIEQPEM